MSHTPGPWKSITGITHKLGVRDSGGFICFMTEPTRYPDQEKRYAKEILEMSYNARLMAAAPELLEALKGILAEVSVRIDDPRIELFDAARAAIKKAIGDEQ